MSTFSTVTLSDEEYYAEFGNYLRYTSSLTIIQIQTNERPFFTQNIEQSIIRTGVLVFHGWLFTSSCIDLFAFSFLIIKLFIIPLLRSIVYLWKKCRDPDNNADGSTESTEPSSHLNSFREGKINQAMILEFDYPVLNASERRQQKYSTSDIKLKPFQMSTKLELY